tara:strand:+ start:88 stop:1749 length:1662 start_codon:yes stop_codon:yes gene_type:complete
MANLHPSVFSIMTQLLSSGMPFDVASGFVGNMMVENMYTPTRGFDGSIRSPEDDKKRYALGINQWRGGRQDKLRNYLDSYGLPIDDLSGQVRFMLEELKDSNYKDPTSFQNYKSFMDLYNQGTFQDIGSITEALEKAYYRADPRDMPNYDPSNPDHRSQLNTYLNSLKMRRDKAKMINDLGINHFGGANNINQPPNPNKKASLISQLTGGLGGLLGGGGSPNMGNLAMAFNSMRLNPDPTLNQAISLRQEKQNEANKLAEGRTRLESYITSMSAGPMKDKYMAMLQSNVEPNEIFKSMIQNRGDIMDQEGAFRKEFYNHEYVANYRAMIPFYDDLVSMAVRGLPSDDLAIVFRFMKLLDPRSTVREGEQASVRQLGGIPAWAGAFYNQVVGAGGLTKDQRNFILQTSRDIFNQSKKNYENIAQQTTERVDRYGNMDIRNIVEPLGISEEQYKKGEDYIGNLAIDERLTTPPKIEEMLPQGASLRDVWQDMRNQGLIRNSIFVKLEDEYGRTFNNFDFRQMWTAGHFSKQDKIKIKKYLEEKYPDFTHDYLNLD